MASAVDTNMVGCKAWRRANLAALCESASAKDAAQGLPLRGAAKRMAQRLSIAPAALSNLVHGVKNMGDETARGIESSLGLPLGAIDAPPHSIAFPDEQSCAAARELLAKAGL